ncbi:hypothetical protein MASR2M78_07040 [Treponema sp.]
MKSITIHDLDDDLSQRIESYATERKLSLNKSIKQILRSALGLSSSTKTYADFTDLCGVWSAAEAQEFENAIKDLEEIEENE